MAAIEQHYTVNQVAALWGVHPKTIRRRFKDESGVLKLGEEETRGKRGYKRGYIKLLIPESVLQKFHLRERNK